MSTMKISFSWGKGGATKAAPSLPDPVISSSASPPETEAPASSPPVEQDDKLSIKTEPPTSTSPSPPLPSSSSPRVPPTNSESSPSTTSTAPSPPSPALDPALAVEAFLAEETLADRLTAIDRILSSFLLNPFDILALPTTISTPDLNKHFRTLSLLVHPDKVPPEHRERAQLAFARLSDARAALLNEEKREEVDEVVGRARQVVITERERDGRGRRGATTGEVYDATKDDDFDDAVKLVMKEMLIDREWRKRQLAKASTVAEGRDATVKEERQRHKEEKAKEDEEYETKRGDRIASWRSFVQGGSKRQKLMGVRAVPKKSQHDSEHAYVRRVVRDDGE